MCLVGGVSNAMASSEITFSELVDDYLQHDRIERLEVVNKRFVRVVTRDVAEVRLLNCIHTNRILSAEEAVYVLRHDRLL